MSKTATPARLFDHSPTQPVERAVGIQAWADIILGGSGHITDIRMGRLRPTRKRRMSAEDIAERQEGIYFHPAICRNDFSRVPEDARPKSWKLGEGWILGTRWLWVDLDTKLTPGDPFHLEWIQSCLKHARRLSKSGLPIPRYVVDSGVGIQFWWPLQNVQGLRLAEPWGVPSEAGKQVGRALKCLAAQFKKVGADPVPTSIATVMRLPFTYHVDAERWNSGFVELPGWTAISDKQFEILVKNAPAPAVLPRGSTSDPFKAVLGQQGKNGEKPSKDEQVASWFQEAKTHTKNFTNRFLDHVDTIFAFEPDGRLFELQREGSRGERQWKYKHQANEVGLACMPNGRWHIRSATLALHLEIPDHAHSLEASYSGLDMAVMCENLRKKRGERTGGPHGNTDLHRRRRMVIARREHPDEYDRFKVEAEAEAKKEAEAEEDSSAPPWEQTPEMVRRRFYEPKAFHSRGVVTLDWDPSLCYGTRSGFRLAKFIEQVIDKYTARGVPIARWEEKNQVAVYLNGCWYRDGEGGNNLIDHYSDMSFSDMWRSDISDQIRKSIYADTNRRLIKHDIDSPAARRGLVNVQNGMIEIATGKLKKHRKKYYSTIQLPVTYDPKAECPQFLDALSLWLPDHSVRESVQMIAGASITPGTPPQQIFFFWGDGNNGKTTFLKILTHILGSGNVSALKPYDLEDRFRPFMLHNKLANLAGDIPSEAISKKVMALLKDMTGGDLVVAERKYMDSFTFVFSGVFIFSGNEQPRLQDTTGGTERRLYPIPWVMDISKILPTNDLQRNFAEHVAAEEGSGIFNWCLEGAQKLIANNNQVPDHTRTGEMKQEWLLSSNPYDAFIQYCTEIQPGVVSTAKELFNGLKQWMEEVDRTENVTSIGLSKALQKLDGVERERRGGVIYHRNIQLKREGKQDNEPF